ncbi:MAG: hypothetical protein RL154_904 [Pseudomonadota bacterium]|jgi:hypothetical protein
MSKNKISICAILLATSMFAEQNLDLASAFTNAKVDGQLRALYIQQTFNLANNQPKINPNSDNSAFAVGGNLGLQTAPYYGLSAGAKFYTSQVLASSAYFGGNPSNPTVASANLSKDFYNMGTTPGQSYSTLGQAFAQGIYGKNSLKIGRQEFNSPLLDAHDSYMIPNLFQGGVFNNRDIADTTIILSYLNGMQGGTTGNSRSNINPQTSFNSLSLSALGNYINESKPNMGGGVIGNQPLYIAAIKNSSLPYTDLQLWYYNNIDVLQAWFAEAKLAVPVAKEWTMNLHAHYYNVGAQGATKTFFANANLAYNSTAPSGSNLKPVAMNNLSYGATSARLIVENPFGLTPEVAASFIGGANNTAYLPNLWGGYPNYAHSEYIYMSNLVSYASLSSGANAKNSNQWRFALTQDLNKFSLGNRSFGIAYSMYNFMKSQNNGLNFNTATWDIIYTCNSALLKNLDWKMYFENVSYNNAILWSNVKSTNIFKLKAVYSF